MLGPHQEIRKYCCRCWREDLLKPWQVDNILYGLAIGMTIGLALLFWPYRCVTCGTSRLNTWVPWRRVLTGRS